MIDISHHSLKLKSDERGTQVYDPIRKKWLLLTPEEHVRQLTIRHLTDTLKYPSSLLAVEKSIKVGNLTKRYDVVVYSRNHVPWMLVECKAPDVPVTKETLYQLLNYQKVVQCKYWLLTNGHQSYCADACDSENIKWLSSLPAYEL